MVWAEEAVSIKDSIHHGYTNVFPFRMDYYTLKQVQQQLLRNKHI